MNMYAFNEDGTQAWNFAAKCSVYSNAEVAPSGNLYFGECVAALNVITVFLC